MPRNPHPDREGRGAIVLAAGASRRMGFPKALLDWSGMPLAAAWVEHLTPWADQVVVVVGAEAPRLRAALPGLRLVENPDWSRGGMISSVRAGLRALGTATAWVAPVDVPIPADFVFAALDARGAPAVPTFAGRPGHPVLLGKSGVRLVIGDPSLRSLRDALRDADPVPVADPRVTADFDDPTAWDRWRPSGSG